MTMIYLERNTFTINGHGHGQIETRNCVYEKLRPRGGGGYSHFSTYVGSSPASTVHPSKNQEFQALPPPPQKKIFEILAT